MDNVILVAGDIDPLCGSVGALRILATGTSFACGDDGWGDELARGFYTTVALAVASLPIGLCLGLIVALSKRFGNSHLRFAGNMFTTVFKGLPELLTLFLIYYGAQVLVHNVLSGLGRETTFEISAFVAGMIALGLVFSAYASDALYAALRAIPRGQYEAAAALGFRPLSSFIFIIFPQVLRTALPGLGNLWMGLLKDTALVSVIGLPDILRQTGVAARVTKQPFAFYGIACMMFLLLALLSSIALSTIERRLRRPGMTV